MFEVIESTSVKRIHLLLYAEQRISGTFKQRHLEFVAKLERVAGYNAP